MQRVVPGEAESWRDTKFRLAVGHPAGEILHFAEETKADWIVMGAKARSGLAGHVPETTAYKVASKAHCPVVTVRTPAERVRQSAGDLAHPWNDALGWVKT